nr:hypothetical protein [Tanacetum cinerariifolium]
MLLSALGNEGGSSSAPAAEGSNPQILKVRALWLMMLLHRLLVSRLRPSPETAPSFRNVFGDAIHMDFFPFFVGPYYVTYHVNGVARKYEFTREEWDDLYRPTFGVLAKEVFKDLAICKTIVDKFPTSMEMTGAEVQEEPYLEVSSTLQRLPFYYAPLATADVVILDPTLEDLAIGTPSSKIVAKAEASHKQKASISGNQGGSSSAPAAEGSNPQILKVRALWLMMLLHRLLVSRLRPSPEPAPSFRNAFGDAIHTDFFPFFVGPYYATYPVNGVARKYEFTREEWDDPYRPTFGFWQRRLKGFEEKIASLTGLELQVSALKKQVMCCRVDSIY